VKSMTANDGWLLALDLSTPRGLLTLDGNGKSFQCEVAAGSRVSRLFVQARNLLGEACIDPGDIEVVGAGRGPGSFTGIRVAVMAAKTLASVLGVPLVAPDSLEAFAEGCRGIVTSVMIALDARRGEVYYGLYDLSDLPPKTLEAPVVAPPQEAVACISALKDRMGGLGLAGSGVAAYPLVWPEDVRVIEDSIPGPEGLSRLCRTYYGLGRVEDPMSLMPLYLRRPDIRVPSAGGGDTP
jgi:tRNA threonylcarbamoyladenosine biosynthesis protein TsaB